MGRSYSYSSPNRSPKNLPLLTLQAVDEDALSVLSHLSSLTTLTLPRCPFVTDAGLAQLAVLPALSALDLRKCRRVTDAGLQHLLGSLRALSSLQVGGCFQLRDRAGLLEKAALRGVDLKM